MAHETSVIKAWLFETLGKDDMLVDLLPGGSSSNVAPQNAPMPFVVWSMQGANDDNTAGARAFAGVTMAVKVVSVAGDQDEQSDAALKRIDALLQDKQFVRDDMMFRVKGLGIIDYPETAAGTRQFNHCGRLWRFTVSNVTVS